MLLKFKRPTFIVLKPADMPQSWFDKAFSAAYRRFCHTVGAPQGRYYIQCDGLADDVFFNEAIDFLPECHSPGGGEIYAPGDEYALTAAVALAKPSVKIRGANKGSTILNLVGAIDGFVVGENDAIKSHIDIGDLKVTGGRYPLRLNNVTESVFENLYLESNTVGLYMEGQIEVCHFSDMFLNGFSQNGILTGQLNGGAIDPLNFPIMQKCQFDRIELRGASGTTAIRLDAGVGYVSGYSSFRNIVSQGEETCALHATRLYNASIQNITNEVVTLPAPNVHSVVKIDTGCAHIDLLSSQLAGRANDGTTYKYVVEQLAGLLYAREVAVVVGAAGTADFYIGGTCGTLLSCRVQGGVATGVVFKDATVRSKSLLVDVKDGAGVPITTWAAGVPFIASDSIGLVTGKIKAVTEIRVGTGQKRWDSSGNAFYDGVADEIVPKVVGRRIRFRRDTDNAPLLDLEADPNRAVFGGGIRAGSIPRGANQGAAGAGAGELWVDSADETVKRGV